MISNPISSLATVSVSNAELRHDRFLGADDLEGSDGRHRQRVADCCGVEWEHGAGFPPWRLAVSHESG